jgi:hypothetical protein
MRVPDETTQCVAFLCVEESGRYVYGGTGFFLGMKSEQHDGQYGYFITARHCVEAAQRSHGHLCVRLNRTDGTANIVRLPNEWYLPNAPGIDIAVMQFGGVPLDVENLERRPSGS